MAHPLEGWDLGRTSDLDWTPWGAGGDARAKVLASGDGYHLTLVEAQPGYAGGPHEHEHTEALYVLDGRLRTQGEELGPGDGYVAAAGSKHTDFATESGATYVSLFKL